MMKSLVLIKLKVIKLFLIFLFLFASCAYPDIDSVPDFKDLKITKEEAIDLCKVNNSDNEQKIEKCIEKINNNKDL